MPDLTQNKETIMSDTGNQGKGISDSKKGEPSSSGTSHRVDAGSVNFDFIIGRAELIVLRAESIKVEDSPNLKYLRLRNGDFLLPQRVIIVFSDGEEAEITIDVPPEETIDF